MVLREQQAWVVHCMDLLEQCNGRGHSCEAPMLVQWHLKRPSGGSREERQRQEATLQGPACLLFRTSLFLVLNSVCKAIRMHTCTRRLRFCARNSRRGPGAADVWQTAFVLAFTHCSALCTAVVRVRASAVYSCRQRSQVHHGSRMCSKILASGTEV